MSDEPRFTFGRGQKLRGRGAFKPVIDARACSDGGAIAVHGCPNNGSANRIGISIGRRAGTAARRNRIKRMIREAYRLSQHELPHTAPGPYDLVVIVRAHEPLGLDEYRTRLADAMRHIHATWQKRTNRRNATEAKPRTAPTDLESPPGVSSPGV